MTELLPLLLTALLLGLAGNVHCLGMCGGLMAALAFRPGQPPSFRLVACYNLGRIGGYALIGLLVGSVSAGLATRWPALGPLLRTAAGLLVIAMGVYLAGWANWLAPLEQLGQRVWQRLPHPSPAALQHGQWLRALATGVAWGWLPSGQVYSAQARASTQGDAFDSALLMAAFGIGTLPAMLATGLLAVRLRRLLQARGFRQFAGITVILFGLWTLALPLWPSAHEHPAHDSAPAHPHQHAH